MTELEKNELMKYILFNLKKINGVNNEVIRYLDEGEVIEFTDAIFTGFEQNAEFKLNHSSLRKIWYSQLNGIYIDPFNLKAATSDLIMKNGDVFSIRELKADGFWNKVREKKFKVKIEENYILRVINSNKGMSDETARRNVCVAFSLIKEKQYERLKEGVEAKPCYGLIEV